MNPLPACAALFLASFAHEGMALASGAVVIASNGAPAHWVALSLIAGIVGGDCLMYTLGATARRSKRLAALIARFVDLGAAERRLGDHVLAAVATCRVVPGTVVPTFAAMGWCGVPFTRVFAATATVTGLYAVTVLTVLTQLGAQWLPHFAQGPTWIWAVPFVVVAALVTWRVVSVVRAKPSVSL
jgi:membrane protein DedA with SNARE-associated domain